MEIVFAGRENIDRIGLLSGEPGGRCRAQARPETLKIATPGRPAVSVSFDDTAPFQNRPVSLRGVTRITVTVKSAYAGQQGQAVAIRRSSSSPRCCDRSLDSAHNEGTTRRAGGGASCHPRSSGISSSARVSS